MGRVSLFADLSERRGPEVATAARRILEWAQSSGARIWWGKGVRDGSMAPIFDYQGHNHYFAIVWTSGNVEMQLQFMRTKPGFESEFRAHGAP